MARTINNCPLNVLMTFKFHGSAKYGNAPYLLRARVISRTGVAPEGGKAHEGDRAELMEEDGTIFGVYYTDNRWRYGTSSEVVSILAKEPVRV